MTRFNLPKIECSTDFNNWEDYKRTALIISEGFEDRCLSWVETISKESPIELAIVYENIPKRESKKEDLLIALKKVLTLNNDNIILETFNRFSPIESEFEVLKKTNELTNFDLIIIDISVMSKLLIIILIYSLRDFEGSIRIIYTEPEEYCPTKQEFDKIKDKLIGNRVFPSFGVHDVVRTPLLSSTSMHNRDTCLIAFTSFNEKLIEALLSTISPHTFLLIGSQPPHLEWREQAAQYLHKDIIEEYQQHNKLDNNGLLKDKTSTLDYRETFLKLHEIYHNLGGHMRVIVAPTGSKMQAVGVAIFKSMYNDVHIEYPMPESFLTKGFSSKKIRAIHSCSYKGKILGVKVI